MTDQADSDVFLTESELAARWKVSTRTLQKRRKKNDPAWPMPAPIQKRPLRYRLDHVKACEDARAQQREHHEH